jgi:D-cysteine desulfhydrase
MMVDCFGADITVCPVEQVHDTIENTLAALRKQELNPYFIPGGGHGNIGTQAYVDCYEEVRRFERDHGICFDYIFHASGTGTTQAGLVCGQLINRDERKIVGISIARRNPRGRNVVIESIREYLAAQKVDTAEDTIEQSVYFIDDYVGGGYGSDSSVVNDSISHAMTQWGIPLDATYTGKAFAGMMDYLERMAIAGKNILFIHTGGTPLYFDGLEGVKHEI